MKRQVINLEIRIIQTHQRHAEYLTNENSGAPLTSDTCRSMLPKYAAQISFSIRCAALFIDDNEDVDEIVITNRHQCQRHIPM